MIETLVVDLGGVAARFMPQRRLEALASLSGLAPEVVQQRLFDSGFERQAELGVYSPEEVLRQVRAALDGRVPGAELIEAWSLAFEANDDVIGYIESLPLRKALFTNNGPILDACLAGPLRGVAAPFDAVVCSWHVRARKPDAAAFERAAQRVRCPPARLLLLDDSVENVEAAVRCGWQAACVAGLADVRAAIEPYMA